MVKPAWPSRLPRSVTAVKGEMCGANPPSLSSSASCRAQRSSYRVSPPTMAPTNTPSGFSAWWIWKREERSVTFRISCGLPDNLRKHRTGGNKYNTILIRSRRTLFRHCGWQLCTEYLTNCWIYLFNSLLKFKIKILDIYTDFSWTRRKITEALTSPAHFYVLTRAFWTLGHEV